MLDKMEIILMHYREGKSQRQMERELKISRKTISKYIKQYEQKRQKLSTFQNDEEIHKVIENIVEKPRYDSSNRVKRKLTDEILSKIKGYLEENDIRKANGMSKQQMKAIDMYECLIEDGHDISYPTVANTVRDLRKISREAYIKQEYELGEVCEFDWGEVKININGVLKIFQMGVFTSTESNYRFCKLYNKQKTEDFLDCHASFFEHIGGVYKTIVYDNMKTVVKKFVGKYEKEPTEALIKLSTYYGFRFRFCNVRSGNEKGHVERSVEYIRRKIFAKKVDFNSLEEAKEYLNNELLKLNARKISNNSYIPTEKLIEEKRFLLPNMPKYDTARVEELRVDKYSTISVDECRYSVPDKYVGEFVFTKIYTDKIICFYDGIKIAAHTRKYGLHEWSIDINHYLNTLKRKPGALANSVAIKQVDPVIKKIYQEYIVSYDPWINLHR